MFPFFLVSIVEACLGFPSAGRRTLSDVIHYFRFHVCLLGSSRNSWRILKFLVKSTSNICQFPELEHTSKSPSWRDLFLTLLWNPSKLGIFKFLLSFLVEETWGHWIREPLLMFQRYGFLIVAPAGHDPRNLKTGVDTQHTAEWSQPAAPIGSSDRIN